VSRSDGSPTAGAIGGNDGRHRDRPWASSEIVASGFSMPHSPRLYDGKLWLLNSGAGEFGVVDPVDGTFHTGVLFVPVMHGVSPSSAATACHRIVTAAPQPDLCRAGASTTACRKKKDAVGTFVACLIVDHR